MEKDKLDGEVKAVKTEDLDNELRKLLKENELTSLEAIKSFAQTIHMMQGFISEKGHSSDDFFKFVEKFPDPILDRLFVSFVLTYKFYKIVADKELILNDRLRSFPKY